MSVGPEERSQQIIAEAEALIRAAQDDMARTAEVFREAEIDVNDCLQALAELPAEQRQLITQATKELVAKDLGLPASAESAPRVRRPRSMI